jgi:hypothetical protein
VLEEPADLSESMARTDAEARIIPRRAGHATSAVEVRRKIAQSGSSAVAQASQLRVD